MGRPIRVLAAAVVVGLTTLVTGCSLSFDLDPMTGETVAVTPTPTPTPTPTDRPYDSADPTTWTDKQLLAQTIFECVPVSNIAAENRAVHRGIGGVVFLGGKAPSNLKQQIRQLVGRAGNGVPPLIASDEEGGAVQRLAGVIYPLRSAEVMGTWPNRTITDTAAKYGREMKRLGVDMAFSPVADLAIGGHFIADQSRGFSTNPAAAAKDVIAWAKGLDSAGVAPVIKHWPGHGRASDTHRGPGRIPAIGKLEKSDLIPFDRAIAAGYTAVMVGHLESKGLTEPGVPASRSPQALARLREQIGDDGLIITDSLTMEAALVGVDHRPGDVVYESLVAGVDVALVCSGPANIVDRVARRISDDGLSRAMLIDKVTRILAWKRHYGVIE